MAVLKTPSILAEKGICHMTRDTITTLPDPNGFSADPLTDLIRSGARKLIEQALEAELVALLAQFSNETTPEGRARIVRHGHLPEREVMTGVGPVPVKVPRVRDRGDQAEKVRFTSPILPPYLRKAKSVEDLLPGCISKTFPRVISRALPRCSARMRRACHPPPSHGSKRTGGRTNAGKGVISALGLVYVWADVSTSTTNGRHTMRFGVDRRG